MLALSPAEHMEFSSMINSGILAVENLRRRAHDCNQESRISTVDDFMFEIEAMSPKP